MSEEFERELSLWEQVVPEIVREGIGYSCEDRKKVCLECADGALSRVAAVHVWGNKLEVLAPLLGDGQLVSFAGFVVEHLEVDGVASKLEAMHDAVIGDGAMAIMARHKGFGEDHVAVGVVREHGVAVATARADGEAACVVSVELAGGFDDNE